MRCWQVQKAHGSWQKTSSSAKLSSVLRNLIPWVLSVVNFISQGLIIIEVKHDIKSGTTFVKKTNVGHPELWIFRDVRRAKQAERRPRVRHPVPLSSVWANYCSTRLLEKFKLFTAFYHLTELSDREDLIKAMIENLDYTM